VKCVAGIARCAAGTGCTADGDAASPGYQVLSVASPGELPQATCNLDPSLSFGSPPLFGQCTLAASPPTALSIFVDRECAGTAPLAAFLPWPLLALSWWHCASDARQRLLGPQAGGRKQAAACSAATTQQRRVTIVLWALLSSLACRSLHCAYGRHRLRAARQLFLLVIHAHTGLLCEPY
jgi:hypothetical protein